jgi:hypothetical protein
MLERNALRPYFDRKIVLVCFGLMQLAAFGAALIVLQDGRSPNPWPIVVTFGLVLGQCALAAAFTVLGPWRFSMRAVCSASIVVLGGVTLVMTDGPRANAADIFLIGLFALLMWIVNQVPLWLCRFFLRAYSFTENSDKRDAMHAQYGIRQLMGLTLLVSLVFGIGRAILPSEAIDGLKRMLMTEWLIFATVAVAGGLIVSTTVITTLSSEYFFAGLIVSTVSSVLVAYGVYSAFSLLTFGPANERIYFAGMLLCTYIWVQLSLLTIRAAGYRIALGG